ncbi:MAG TPA: PKD domain-containing protein [Thermoplasmata archaeon]|nr:PKD domain-containing protein [Thermoplasmata archaeon]
MRPVVPSTNPFAVANWTQVRPSVDPGDRWAMAMVYDASDGYVFAYSGTNYSVGPINDSWKFQHGVWTQLNITNSPGPVGSDGGQDIVYDPIDGYVVLIVAKYGSSGAASPADQLTWSYHAGAWTNRTTATAPPAVWRESFTWDYADHYAVLFGGCLDGNCVALSNATWTFVGGVWTNRTPTAGPPPMARADLQYDPIDGYTILFGGYLSTGAGVNTTYEYRAGNWTLLSPAVSPSQRDGAPIATLGNHGGVYLFGGEWGYGAKQSNDTWYFQGGNWTLLNASSGPNPLCCTMMTWDANDSAIVEFGGYSNSYYTQETWELKLPMTAIVSVAPNATDVGRPVEFNGTGVDGIDSNYSYYWAFGDGANSSQENVTHSYSANGTYTYRLWVNDSSGQSSQQQGTVHVQPRPTLHATATVPASDVGLSSGFRANVSGGTAPFRYNWTFGDGNSSTLPDPSHTFASPGSYPITCEAIDAVDVAAYSNFSLVVNPDEIVAITPSRTVVDVGQSVHLDAKATNGTPPFTTAWNFGDGSRAFGDAVNHSYGYAGNFTVRVWINDSAGESSLANLTLTVHPPLAAVVVRPASPEDAGRRLPFRAAPNGGTPAYTVLWSFGDGSSAAGADVNHTFLANGTFSVWANVTDTVGATYDAEGSILIEPTPTVTVDVAGSYAIPGVARLLTAHVAGGIPPFTYDWNFGDGNFSNGSSATVAHTYGRAGAFTASVNVTDAVGSRTSGLRSVDVVGALRAAFTSSSTRITLGQTVLFEATPQGGLGPYGFAWSGLPDGCLSANTSSLACTPTSPGDFVIGAKVSDSSGTTVGVQRSLTVEPALLGSASASADVASSCTGPYTVAFTSQAAGGVAPYSYRWSFGDGAPTTSATDPTHSYNSTHSPATFPVTLTIEDADNATRNVSVTATIDAVACPAVSTPPMGLTPLDEIAIAIVGIAALAGAVLYLRRGGGPSPGRAEAPEPPPTGPSP